MAICRTIDQKGTLIAYNVLPGNPTDLLMVDMDDDGQQELFIALQKDGIHESGPRMGNE